MNFSDFRAKWAKIRKLLETKSHMEPKTIPTAGWILDEAKKYDFSLEFNLLISSLIALHPEVKDYMAEVGFIESNDEKGWKKLHKEWKKDAKTLYAAEINFRQQLRDEQWARENINDFSENSIQEKLKIYTQLDDKNKANAIRKVNAEQEYYQDYNSLTAEQKKKISSNDVSQLIALYEAEAGNEKLQKYLNKRIERLMNKDKAFGKASADALDMQGKADKNSKSTYGKMVRSADDNELIWFPDMAGKHPGIQATQQGCWSVTLSALLKHKGLDVSQSDIRQYKLANDLDYSNKDSGQFIGDYAPLINELVPNSMVCNAQQELVVSGYDDYVNAKKTLKNMLHGAIEMSKSPVGLWIKGHYRVVYGVEAGKDGDKVYLQDPFSAELPQEATLGQIIDESLRNGVSKLSVDWIQEFKVNDKKEITDIPDKLAEEIKKDPNADIYTYKSEYGDFSISVQKPEKIYTKEELKQLRKDAADKWRNSKELDEKLKRWDDNSKESLKVYEDDFENDPYFNSNDNYIDDPDILESEEAAQNYVKQIESSIEKNGKLIEKIDKTLKDYPTEDNFEQAKKIVSPGKIEELRKEAPESAEKLRDIQNKLKEKQKKLTDEKNTLNEELGVNKRNRQEIFDAYNAIRDTKDYGRKSHEPFHNMLSALRDYKLSCNGNGAIKYTGAQKAEAAKRVHDACVAYLEKHVVTDKSGKTKIGGQTYTVGALRKQAAVQILELMEELPEYQKAIQKEAEDKKAGIAEPENQAKGKNGTREKIDFNQLKGALKESLEKHTKTKSNVKEKAAYADLEAAKAKNRSR